MTRWGVAGLAVLLFALALGVDTPVDHALRDSAVADALHRHAGVSAVLRLPGGYTLTVVSAAALLIARRPRGSLLMLLGTGLAGGIAGLLKSVFGRSRPGTWPGTPNWVLFRGGWHGFWHQNNVSFVSGDATQAFAWAAALGFAFPRYRWAFYAAALCTGLQRVVVSAHWPSDVVGGAIVGVVTVRLLVRILSPTGPAPQGPAESP